MIQSDEYLHELASFGFRSAESGDEERFNKAAMLAKKVIQDEFTIAFAGHFSAGKSSMINALTGEDLLPSSPIPTSANIVKIYKSDEDFAIIHHQNGTSVKIMGEGFPSAIKQMSREGETIASIEIGHTMSRLSEGIAVMDTPGVDSTDDAHRLSTESTLHIADIVFYTMDYNHIQSELNFRFTKELMRYNPNVYLIVNQIDKHRSEELSFEEFKESVKHSFSLWGVVPKGIFFTSLKNPEMENNDFSDVKKLVNGFIQNRDEQLASNLGNAFAQLKAEHIEFSKQEIESVQKKYPTIQDEEWADPRQLKDNIENLSTKLELLSGDSFHIQFEQRRKELLQSATLTPYETRELLKDYLESKTSQFRVGILFSSKKTEEERERRLQLLSDSIEKLAHTQIEVHLRQLMKNVLTEAGLLTDERSLHIDELDLSFEFEDIRDSLLTPDILTGELILNAASQLRDQILNVYKRKTDSWKLQMAKEIKIAGQDSVIELRNQLNSENEKLNAILHVQQMNATLQAFETNSARKWSSEEEKAINQLQLEWRDEKELEVMYIAKQDEDIESTTHSLLEGMEELVEESSFNTNHEHVMHRAKEVANRIQHIPGFQDVATYLRSKSERLEHKDFTVALFGAFSAGKSSFSNALLGESVLPVSPNPTTATINRIRPVINDHMDETADIHFKKREQMEQDVIAAFSILGFSINSLEEAYKFADEALRIPLEEESLHIHKSFVRAFQEGYEVHRNLLGTTMNAKRNEFVQYVAEEAKSCFVESIDFYFDCELTRQGITLVDTPGADSINARHTDVAFEYIRNADAILFITYYNHAFSRADREFLIQLGRVKDTFEMDKMFFIVNAIDLAACEEEAREVKEFVAGELVKFGIRNPRVRGISSLQALESKIAGNADERMNEFEEQFYSFLANDLNKLAIQALEEEIDKSTRRLSELIKRTEIHREQKAARLEDLAKKEQQINEHFSKSFAPVLRKAAQEELKELIYYIHQRVFLRFSDFFKEGYSPSLFARHHASEALRIALEETIGMTGFDFMQELKVTNLRMLKYMQKQLKDRQHKEGIWLAELDEAFTPVPFDLPDASMLAFSAPFQEINRYSTVNRLFKNQKAFFEKGDRLELQEQLMEMLKKDATAYLEEERVRLSNWADGWIETTSEKLASHLLVETNNQLEAERDLLESHDKLSEWKMIYNQIQ